MNKAMRICLMDDDVPVSKPQSWLSLGCTHVPIALVTKTIYVPHSMVTLSS